MNSEAIWNGKKLSVNQQEKVAYKMRKSRKYSDEAYLKMKPQHIENNFIYINHIENKSKVFTKR